MEAYPRALSGQMESFDRDFFFAPWSRTYFHRKVRHMIVFSRPPGWRRRAGDVGTSSSDGDTRRWPRKPRPSGRSCTSLRSPRAVLVMGPSITVDLREPATPSDVCHPPMKVSTQRAPHGRRMGGPPVGCWPLHRPRALQCLHATGDVRPDPPNHYNLLI